MNAQTPQGGMAGRLPSMQAARWLAQARNEKGHPLGVAFLRMKLDDDLLSHGEAPHYHRRCVVSLLSSGWDQVVPTLYGRQAIRLGSRRGATPNQVCDSGVSIRYLRFMQAFGLSHATIVRLFGCYMVKPHGQLVSVSSTPHSAYTPDLSTS